MRDRKRIKRRPPVKPPILLLPDDVVMEILSRTPAVDVLKFRRVCRRWNSLILSECFSDMHMKNQSSFPMIVVHEKSSFGKTRNLLFLDRWEPPRKRTKNLEFSVDSVLPSSEDHFKFQLHYDGLIAMSNFSCNHFVIFNPITGDKVSIMLPHVYNCELLGMFFHPSIKEYCILWGTLAANPKPLVKMVNLSAKPLCKDLNPLVPMVHTTRDYSRTPVVIEEDATLYWTMRDVDDYNSAEELIMGFHIKSEEFSLIPHPGPSRDDCNRKNHLGMQIFKMNEHLSFLLKTATSTGLLFDIWSLTDSANGIWMKIHSVSINIDRLGDIGSTTVRYFVAVAVVNGELLAKYTYRGEILRIFGFNIETGTIRKIGRAYTDCRLSTYTPSFASLKNCGTEIRM